MDRLSEPVHDLRVEYRDLDAPGSSKRQRKVQRVHAGGLQRYAHHGLALPQPRDQHLVTGGSVGEFALGKSLILLDGHRQSGGADIDTAEHGCLRVVR